MSDSKPVGLYLKETDTAVFEYMRLPSIDLSERFMYRFTAPIATTWKTDGVRVAPEGSEDRWDYESHDAFALRTFNAYRTSASPEDLAKAKELIPWLYAIEKVKVVECHIVPIEPQP
jgi:hypothetical protein